MGKELNVNLNLYDFNKANMAQIKPYDPIIVSRKCAEVANDIWDMERPSYWMLLCRERSDYTVFYLEYDLEKLKSALIECLNNRGYVLDITKQDNGAYEIWIRDFDTDENVVYYLFNYEQGVIEV